MGFRVERELLFLISGPKGFGDKLHVDGSDLGEP